MSAPPLSLIDGEPVDHVSVADRGLQYGDGLFETMVCRDGEPRWFERHWVRLATGCERLRIAMPDRDGLQAELRRLAAGSQRCVIKLIYTRGAGIVRGYRPSGHECPTRIMTRHPWTDTPAAPFHVLTSTVRMSGNRLLAGIKHLNRLESVLAQQQLADTPGAEAIMLSPSGSVICGSMSNVFLIEEGGLLTPALNDSGVQGVMRGCVLQACAVLGIRVQIAAVSPAALQTALALMVTNVRLGLQAVDSIDGRSLRRDGRVELLSRWIEAHV